MANISNVCESWMKYLYVQPLQSSLTLWLTIRYTYIVVIGKKNNVVCDSDEWRNLCSFEFVPPLSLSLRLLPSAYNLPQTSTLLLLAQR